MELWFSHALLNWYKKNQRDLPWRREKDPYKIWISEIILQQTQVAQGLAYYYKFIERFPQVKQLAEANEDEVMKLWQGLGYYSRARNLHAAAKTITNLHHGKIPADYEKILSLKGIGEYTAAAIASFAFDLPYAVLDGNVYRLLSRLFGIKTPIDASRAKKEFSALANLLLDKRQAAMHNQAIMEFGSQFCKPVNPNCADCIFSKKCIAFKEQIVSQLPIKLKKIKVKKRYLNYLVIVDKNYDLIVEKRKAKDIWQSLYQFPLIETQNVVDVQHVLESSEAKAFLKGKHHFLFVSKSYKHVLTHQLLYANFYVFKSKTQHSNKYEKTNVRDLKSLAFPRLIEIFLNDHSLKEIN